MWQSMRLPVQTRPRAMVGEKAVVVEGLAPRGVIRFQPAHCPTLPVPGRGWRDELSHGWRAIASNRNLYHSSMAAMMMQMCPMMKEFSIHQEHRQPKE